MPGRRAADTVTNRASPSFSGIPLPARSPLCRALTGDAGYKAAWDGSNGRARCGCAGRYPVRPQLGDNIGQGCTRHANAALSSLRLGSPRDGWPNAKARAPVGARRGAGHSRSSSPRSARRWPTSRRWVATTARKTRAQPAHRHAARAASGLRGWIGHAEGRILFGPERTGSPTERLGHADRPLYPAHPAFSSLNIAQRCSGA